MDRRAFLVGSAALVSGCLGSAASGDYDIGMTLEAFDPKTITVSPGTEVVWKNTSSRGHTVTAYEGAIPDTATYFASGGYDDEQTAREEYHSAGGGVIDGNGTYKHTFEEPGIYEYVCVPHERGGMVGTIKVEK